MAVTDFTTPLVSYAYPIAFVGAIFFGVSSLVSFEPASVITNKNVSVFVNVTIAIAGFLSFYAWYNQPLTWASDFVDINKIKKSVNDSP